MARRAVILGNGVVGAEKQCVALAEAVGRALPAASGLPFSLRRVQLPTPMRRLPTRLQLAAGALLGVNSRLARDVLADGAAPPALAISCGRASIPASVALKEAARDRTLTVHVQRPACDTRRFDLVVAPRHDYATHERVPSNVFLTDGSLHGLGGAEPLRRAAAEWRDVLHPYARPRLVLLLGGAVSRRWWQRPLAPELTAESTGRLVRSAADAVARRGGSLLVSTSRRTPARRREFTRGRSASCG